MALSMGWMTANCRDKLYDTIRHDLKAMGKLGMSWEEAQQEI